MNYSEKEDALLKCFPIESEYNDINPILFKDFHFDTEKNGYLLALSQLGYQCHWKGFPSEIIPRLKGMRKQIQVRYAISIHGLLDLFSAINEASVPYFIIDNLAFRFYGLDKIPLCTCKIFIQTRPQYKEKISTMVRAYNYNCNDSITRVFVGSDVDISDSNIERVVFLGVSVPVPKIECLINIQKLLAIKNFATSVNSDVLFYFECFLKANGLKCNDSFDFPLLKTPNKYNLVNRIIRKYEGYQILKQYNFDNCSSFFTYIMKTRRKK